MARELKETLKRTLGFLVAAEIKPIPIKEYMQLTYKPVMGNLKGLAQV